MTNKSSPWLERQRRDRAGPKVLTPAEAEAAGLPLTEGAISYHVYRGNKHTMPESDLWVEADFPTSSTSLDAKLSDGSPRFIKRPDGTMFDLYGTATRVSMAEPNCPAPGEADPLTDFSEMESRIKAEFYSDLTRRNTSVAGLTSISPPDDDGSQVPSDPYNDSPLKMMCCHLKNLPEQGCLTLGKIYEVHADMKSVASCWVTNDRGRRAGYNRNRFIPLPVTHMTDDYGFSPGSAEHDEARAKSGRVGTWPTIAEIHEKITRPDAPSTGLPEWRSAFFPPVGTAVNTLHWVKDGIGRPEAMEWTGDAWLMIGDATRYGPEHTELRGCEYLGSGHPEDEMAAHRAGLERDEAQKKLDSVIGKFNYACNAVSELQTDLNAVTTERNALRDALAKFTDPDVKPSESPINHALRVKIGDHRRMGIGGTG